MVHVSTARKSIDDQSGVGLVIKVSLEMVRLYKEQIGRGPRSVQTHWAGADALVVLLEDTLTEAERNMVKRGEHQRLRDTRNYFQYATVREFCGPVERITGHLLRERLPERVPRGRPVGGATAAGTSGDVCRWVPAP